MDKIALNRKFILSWMLVLFIQIMPSAFAQPISTPNRSEIVVLIHGLMRTTLSMYPLKFYLTKQGYKVYTYSYPSPKYTIKGHGVYLHEYIVDLIKKNPGVKINFITHSMGGIITREAVAQLSDKQLESIGALIMLAPPNQGSYLAKLSTQMFPVITLLIKPLGELSSEQTAYVHHVPIPKIKMGIIAGRFDAKVPPSSAILKSQIAMVEVNSTHTFIMNNSETKKFIISFLRNGTF